MYTQNHKYMYKNDRVTRRYSEPFKLKICAFSGISLWFLDNGIKSNWQVDWVDHIKPSASGGRANISNGICASNLFNAKKRDNSHDNIYFVKNGNLTEPYFSLLFFLINCLKL